MTTALPCELTLPYLGKRQYLHGTTLFDALLPFVPADSRICYKLSHLIETDRVRLEAGTSPIAAAAHATLTCETEGRVSVLRVSPLPSTPDPSRTEYDETLVTLRAQFADGTATFEGASSFTFIATLVPLHKALVQRTVPHDDPGQWLFARLDLRAIPMTFEAIGVRIASGLGGRLVRSDVSVDGVAIGAIYFSWWNRA